MCVCVCSVLGWGRVYLQIAWCLTGLGMGFEFYFCTQSPCSHVWLCDPLTACQALGCKAIPFWVRWFEQGSDFMFLKDPLTQSLLILIPLDRIEETHELGWKKASLYLVICNWNLACLPIMMYAANHDSISDFDMNRNYRYFHIILLLVVDILKCHL